MTPFERVPPKELDVGALKEYLTRPADGRDYESQPVRLDFKRFKVAGTLERNGEKSAPEVSFSAGPKEELLDKVRDYLAENKVPKEEADGIRAALSGSSTLRFQDLGADAALD